MSLPLIVTEDALEGREDLPALLYRQVATLLDAGVGWSALPSDLRAAFCLRYYWREVLGGGHQQFIGNATNFHGGSPLRILGWAGEGALDLGLAETAAIITAMQDRLNAGPQRLASQANPDDDLDDQLYRADNRADKQDPVDAALTQLLLKREPKLLARRADYNARLRELAEAAVGPDTKAIKQRRLRQEVLTQLPDAHTALFRQLMEGTLFEDMPIGVVTSIGDGQLEATADDQLTRFTCTFEAGRATLRQTPTPEAQEMGELLRVMRRRLHLHVLGLASDANYRSYIASNRAKLKLLRQQLKTAGSPVATLPDTAGQKIAQQITACGVAEAVTLICAERGLTLRNGTRATLDEGAGILRVAMPTTDNRWMLIESNGKILAAQLDLIPPQRFEVAFLLQMRRQLDQAATLD